MSCTGSQRRKNQLESSILSSYDALLQAVVNENPNVSHEAELLDRLDPTCPVCVCVQVM